MKCISSPALNDAQILMFVEGEADAAVVSHIGECHYCREKARRWTRLQNRLRKQSYRVTCPTPMELGDYHLGYLPAPDALVMYQHLSNCPSCRHEMDILKNLLDIQTQESGWLGTAKVLIARLVGGQAGNGLGPATPVLRGEGKGPLTFEADGIVIVLDIQPITEGKIDILGQVAADDQERWTDALVEIRHGDEPRSSTLVDDLGAFRCESIQVREQELRIVPVSGSPVVVANLEL